MPNSAKASPPMQETINSANAAASVLFLGHDGEWWDFWLIASVIFAALAAVTIGITTTGSIVSHKREAVAAETALEKYKLDTGGKISESAARTAEANARALEAQLSLERFKAPRVIPTGDVAKIVSEMGKLQRTSFTMGVFQDPESLALMNQLSDALVRAGWTESEWKSGGDIIINRGSRPSFGYTFVTGVYVQADIANGTQLAPAVERLAKLLADSGIETKAEIGRMGANTNNSDVKILIGQKPR